MYYRLFISVLILCLSKSQAQQADIEIVPILDHSYKLTIYRLLEISAYEVGIDRISRKKKAETQYRRLLEDLDSVSREAEPDSETLYKALLQAVSLAHFYGINNHLERADERLTQVRAWVQTFSSQFVNLSKNSKNAAWAKYYGLIAKFGQSDGKGAAVTQLMDLKKEVQKNPVLVANIDLLVGYSLVLSTSTMKQGKDYLKRAPSSSVYGRIAHRLTRTLMESGVDGEGKVYDELDPKFNKDLAYVLNISKGAPTGVQEFVLDTAFFIWKARDPTLETQLFDVEAFKGLLPADAYIERLALKHIREGDFTRAINRYQEISKYYRGKKFGYRIDRRIWKLYLQIYLRNKDIKELQIAFKNFWNRYNQSKKAESKRFKNRIKSDFKKITTKLIIAGAKKSQEAPLAIETAKFLLAHISSRREAYNYKLRSAQLMMKIKRYDEAVDIFLDLTKDNPEKNFPLAIKAQSRLAFWPLQPPWSAQISQRNRSERLKLLSIYEKSSKFKGSKVPWETLAHMGLLYRSLGKRGSAESLWWKFLQGAKNTNKHAMEAAGVLFTDYYQLKRWNNLIELSYLALKNKFSMTYQLKPIQFQKPFSDALFTQGELDIKAKNLDRATKYLADFIKFFPSDPRVPQAYHGLGNAYKGLGKLVPALNAFKILADKFPKYPARKYILTTGGNWAVSSKKTVEYAFFFYGRYLRDYSQDANIPQIRERLAQIYLSQKLYGWASRLYKEQSLSRQVPPQVQLQAAIKYLDIEEKYGQPNDAAFGANRILQLAKPDSLAAGKAYGFLAKYAVSRNDIKEMQALEPKLRQISKNSKEAREALGLMKFKIAQIYTSPIKNTEANAFLKDPEGAVKGYFDMFNREKVHYESVCTVGMTESCAPAMFKLVYLAETAMVAINDVEIASTLEESRVNAFKVFKQLHMSKLEQAAKYYAQNALRLARNGTTSSIWKTEIIKALGSKTSFGVQRDR